MMPETLILLGKFAFDITGSLSALNVPEVILSALILVTKDPSPLKNPAVIIPVE